MEAVVEIEDLEFRYEADGFTLSLPALTVGRGERVVFVGPSGSGKTTLLHLVAGILLPRAGRVRVLGTSITGLGDAARRRFRIRNLGIIFQEFELLEHLSVRENIRLPYYLNPALRATPETDSAVRGLSDSLGLGALLRRRPRHLSHGERQRVAIARSLVAGPSLILADEPTGNLDPENTAVMLDLVFREVRDRGCAFLMVTHDHSLLDRFDRVVDFRDLLGGRG